MGSNDNTQGGYVRTITAIRVFPTWNFGADDGVDDEVGDLALLKLDATVPVAPLQIAETPVLSGSGVRAIGWGRVNPDGSGEKPTTLRQLDTTILKQEACNAGYIPIGKGELCVDTPGGAATCSGDSGGPAVKKVAGRWRLVGSVSRRTWDLCGDGPDMFTDVMYYRGWISSVISR